MNARPIVVFVFAVASLENAFGQSLYRCESDGKTFFQDRPCAFNQQRVLSETDVRQLERQKSESAAAAKKAASDEQTARERRQQETGSQAGNRYHAERARACGFKGEPQIGQTAGQVTECFAEPDEKNATITPAGRREQWVYRGWGYVYINELGRVDTVQHRR